MLALELRAAFLESKARSTRLPPMPHFASAVVRVPKIFGLRERVIGRKRTHMSIVEHCDPAAEVSTSVSNDGWIDIPMV
jgi:hypothetical protein